MPNNSTLEMIERQFAREIVQSRPTEELELIVSTSSGEILGLPILEAAKQELLNRSEKTILGEEE